MIGGSSYARPCPALRLRSPGLLSGYRRTWTSRRMRAARGGARLGVRPDRSRIANRSQPGVVFLRSLTWRFMQRATRATSALHAMLCAWRISTLSSVARISSRSPRVQGRASRCGLKRNGIAARLVESVVQAASATCGLMIGSHSIGGQLPQAALASFPMIGRLGPSSDRAPKLFLGRPLSSVQEVPLHECRERLRFGVIRVRANVGHRSEEPGVAQYADELLRPETAVFDRSWQRWPVDLSVVGRRSPHRDCASQGRPVVGCLSHR